MTQPQQRRQYEPSFKAEAVRLVTEGGQRPVDVARQLGMTTKMLSQWRRQFAQSHAPSTPSIAPALAKVPDDRSTEVAQLRRRIAVLEQEREVLKKAIGIFVERKE